MANNDAALIAFCGVFLCVALTSCSWEIWTRTPWQSVRDSVRRFILKFWKSACNLLYKFNSNGDQPDGNQSDGSRPSEETPSKSQPDEDRSPAKQSLSEKEITDSGTETGQSGQSKSGLEQTVAKQLSTESGTSDSNTHASQSGILEKKKKFDWRRWLTWLPGLLWLFSVIPASMFYRHSAMEGEALLSRSSPGWNNTTMGVNPDIGGIGIRVGLYIPIGLAIITLLAGLLHNEDSGAKEIGNAQLLTLFYLNFNAVKAAAPKFKGLTFPEIMIACMCIDLTAAGLQMTSSGKETLASRWFIFASALNQIVAAAIVVAMLAMIQYNYLFSSGHCAHVIWWGRIDSCTGPSASTWIYIAVRWCILIHGLWLDWRHSHSFHVIEKDWRSLAAGDQYIEKRGGEDGQKDYPYGLLPATVFSKWLEFLPSVVVGIAGIETLVRRIPSSSAITDWGQSAALVLAIAGGIHWVYVIYQVLLELRELLDRDRESVNFPRYDDGWKPDEKCSKDRLLAAAKEGNAKVIRWALRHDADVNAKDDKDNMTALLHAVRHDNLDLVFELMSPKHLADPTRKGTIPAVCLAAQEGRLKVLRCFIPKPTARRVPRLRRLLRSELARKIQPRNWQGIDPHQLDFDGRSPLWLAAMHDQKEAIEYICVAWPEDAISADCSKQDPSTNRTLLFELADIEIHQVIRDTILRLCPERIRKETLKKAEAERNPKVLATLLKAGIGASGIDQEGSSVLHRICHDAKFPTAGFSTVVDAHIESGQQIDMFDKDDRTPLHVAVLSDDAGFVGVLCKAGADPFKTGFRGETPFSLAVKESRRRETLGLPISEFFSQLKGPNQDKLLSHLLALPDDEFPYLCRYDYGALYASLPLQNRPLIIHVMEHGHEALFRALVYGNSDDELGCIQRFHEKHQGDIASPSWCLEKLKILAHKASEEDRVKFYEGFIQWRRWTKYVGDVSL